jgi:stress response protein YsnF
MAQTVIGIFDDNSTARNAVERLTQLGFDRTDIDLSAPGHSDAYDNTKPIDRVEDDNSFGERVSRFFQNLFDDDDDTRKYSTVATRGTVVSVHTDSKDEAERAADLLDECGAVNVDERAVQYGTTSSATTLDTRSTLDGSANRTSFDRDDDTTKSIPVIDEDVQIGKREVERGGVRLRSRIVERPVEESLRLREEHVRVDRNPVNRPATEADFNTFREGEIELRERAEVPVVNKDARVVEEVNVHREVGEREELVRETARKTDVDVESIDSESDSSLSKNPNKKI